MPHGRKNTECRKIEKIWLEWFGGPLEVKHLDLETLEAARIFALHFVRCHLRLRIYELKEEQCLQWGSSNGWGSGSRNNHLRLLCAADCHLSMELLMYEAFCVHFPNTNQMTSFSQRWFGHPYTVRPVTPPGPKTYQTDYLLLFPLIKETAIHGEKNTATGMFFFLFHLSEEATTNKCIFS